MCSEPRMRRQIAHMLVATKSRRYSKEDKDFIAEVQQLLEKGIIEPSDSPWRAQVVVTRNETHSKRLVIYYSQIINRFTQLDAYPLPRIDDTINKIAQYKVLTQLTLKVHTIKFQLEMKRRNIPLLKPTNAYINSVDYHWA